MPTSKNLNSLIINKVESKEVYEWMKTNNKINEDELYLTPDTESSASPFVDWTPQYTKMLENGGNAAKTSEYWGFMLNPDGTYLMDDGMYYIDLAGNFDSREYLTITTSNCNGSTVRQVIREYVSNDPFWYKEIWVKPLEAADQALAAYFSSEEGFFYNNAAVLTSVANAGEEGKYLKAVNGRWKAADAPSGGTTLKAMKDIDSYIGVPTADVPTDGMLQLIITGHESTEMAIGTITIQDGAITTNAMISWYEGNASLLESIVIVANGLTVQGWSAGSYCGTYQLVTQ